MMNETLERECRCGNARQAKEADRLAVLLDEQRTRGRVTLSSDLASQIQVALEDAVGAHRFACDCASPSGSPTAGGEEPADPGWAKLQALVESLPPRGPRVRKEMCTEGTCDHCDEARGACSSGSPASPLSETFDWSASRIRLFEAMHENDWVKALGEYDALRNAYLNAIPE